MSEAKDDSIARPIKYWNPGKTLEWQRTGVDLVIDRREDYYLYDLDGRRLIDLHLNGGIYSLGVGLRIDTSRPRPCAAGPAP